MPSFLVDEDLPRSLAALLRKYGHPSDHVTDLRLRGAPDAKIFSVAQERKAGLISRDSGFANILEYPLGSHHGIVLVRFPAEMRTDALLAEIIEMLARIRADEYEGALILLEPGRIRMRGQQRK